MSASDATDLVIDINGYYAASFGTPSGGYEFPSASGTPLMTIGPSGNVGIGTTTPGSTLDVAGDINFSGSIRFQGTPVLQVPGGANLLNTAVGRAALSSNTTGRANMATGSSALEFNTTGFENTATGASALESNTTGSGNTATGAGALGLNTTGENNTTSGAGALGLNTTGAFNTATGMFALNSNTTGNNNIAIGYHAAVNLSGTNSNNIHIGTTGKSSDANTIRIGAGTGGIVDSAAQTSFFAAGIYGAMIPANDNVPVLIDSVGQLGTVKSSRRYKEDIQDMGNASSGLMRLRPVTFRYQKPFADGSKPIQYGLIAEEVADVYPDLVAHSADGQIETVKYQVLDSMLLNEVQKQQKEVGSQQEEIRQLRDENQALKDRLARLEAAMEKMASGAGSQ